MGSKNERVKVCPDLEVNRLGLLKIDHIEIRLLCPDLCGSDPDRDMFESNQLRLKQASDKKEDEVCFKTILEK